MTTNRAPIWLQTLARAVVVTVGVGVPSLSAFYITGVLL